jgi:hypothetical protein
MIGVTLIWSIVGVITRHLELARSFEITSWRSAFNASALVVLLTVCPARAVGLAARASLRRPGGVALRPVHEA